MKLPLLKIRELTKVYPNRKSLSVQSDSRMALSNVSFDIYPGEVLAVVGESGSGKTTLGKCLIRLIQPTSGNVFYEGEDIIAMPEKRFRQLRNRFQMIFQNPVQAFNPKMSVFQILSEAARRSPAYRKGSDLEIINQHLHLAGLNPDLLPRYPGEISGGQTQRVAICRALIMHPQLLIADEPTSSLDSAVKHKLLEVLMQLKKSFGLTILLITHDLALVSRIADRIAIMYGGQLVELGTRADIFDSPCHPYTRLLLSAANFVMNDRYLSNDVPVHSPFSPVLPMLTNGCVFADRCPVREPDCFHTQTVLEVVNDNHIVGCFRKEKWQLEPAEYASPDSKKQLKGEALE